MSEHFFAWISRNRRLWKRHEGKARIGKGPPLRRLRYDPRTAYRKGRTNIETDGVIGGLSPDLKVAVPTRMVKTWSLLDGHKHRGGTAVKHYAGLDVSLEETAICVVAETGRIVKEVRAASEPEGVAAALEAVGLPL